MKRYTFFSNGLIDGAGSMLQREIYAYFFSRLSNDIFVRTPYQIDTTHETSFVARHLSNLIWRQTFSFLGEMRDDKVANLECECDVANVDFETSRRTILALAEDSWANLLLDFRRSFATHTSDNRRKICTISTDNWNVALHLRNYSKGDTQLGLDSFPWEIFSEDYSKFGIRNNNHRFYSNLYAACIIRLLAASECYKSPFVSIYSTGRIEDFDLLAYQLCAKHIPFRLCINRPSYTDFYDLTFSDEVILAKSSFSYLTALCSTSKMWMRGDFRIRMPPDVSSIHDTFALPT